MELWNYVKYKPIACMVEGSNWFFDQSPLETYHNVRRFCLMQSIILWSWCENKSFYRIHLFVATKKIPRIECVFQSRYFLSFPHSLSLFIRFCLCRWHFMCLPKTESDNSHWNGRTTLRAVHCKLILFHFLLLIVSNEKMYYFDLFHARLSFIHHGSFFSPSVAILLKV